MRTAALIILIALARAATPACAAAQETASRGGSGEFRQVAEFPGADPAAQINECLRAVPPSGGVCDARSVAAAGGAVEVYSNMFAGVTSPFELLLGSYTLNIQVPQVVRARSLIRGAGPTTIMYYSGTGPMITLDYRDAGGLALWVQAGLSDLYLDGPGKGSQSVGILLGADGGAGGAAGIEIGAVAVRQFGTNVQIASNAYSVHLTDCFIENAATGVMLSSGDQDSGEMISLVGTFIADSDLGVAIPGSGFELECVDCSFDFDGTAVDMSGASVVTTANTHWEAQNGSPFVIASAGVVTISGGLWVSDAQGGFPWPSYVQAEGSASVSVSGSAVSAYGTQLSAFVDWQSSGNLFLQDDTFLPPASVGAAASGFPGRGTGVVQAVVPAAGALAGDSLALGGGPPETGVSGTGANLLSDVGATILSPTIESPAIESPTMTGAVQMPGSYRMGGATIRGPVASGRVAVTSQLPLLGLTPPIGARSRAGDTLRGDPGRGCGRRRGRSGPCRRDEPRPGPGARCRAGTADVPGAAAGGVAVASPLAFPGAGVTWDAYISGPGEVTVVACGQASPPRRERYAVRVLCEGPCGSAPGQTPRQ